MSAPLPDRAVSLIYTNWRGETAARMIVPGFIRYGANEWHREPQWLLLAFDVDKGADREFALAGFLSPARAVPDEIDPAALRAAWVAFRGDREGMLVGPGPGFQEAIAAYLATVRGKG